ncbi:MAG: squalene--hopene cyclase [Candidatus Omnitrophota bacterium]|jgi:squalene-hopene/tetraprenyl-beta-curcumene cyclase|nr:MAG: squalene--hopene cyclase [Candidatus Omnitrophota bacterium]
MALNPGIPISDTDISCTSDFAQAVLNAIQSTQQFFLSTQTSAGYWSAYLEADSTLVADYIMLARYIGHESPVLEQKAVRRLLNTQLDDGGWNIYYNGPSELNATVKCAYALQLAGMSSSHEALIRAKDCILRHGGLAKVNSYTRFYMGLFGSYPWKKLVSIPPELMFLPTSFYFNIYEISSWSRAILVPMSIIWSHRPIKTPPPTVDCGSWWLPKNQEANGKNLRNTISWKTFFFTMDAILKRSHRFYSPFTRRESLRRAERWMLEHMSRGGGLAAIYPAMLNSIIALDCLGYDHDHPTFQHALDEFMKLMVEEDDVLWFQPCFSPVWDTAMVTASLERSGMPSDHPAIQRSAEWLINQEIGIRGDWQVKNPYGPASGWVFEFENDFYADTDDSAMVLMALHGSRIPLDARRKASMKRGVEWVLSMQSSDGGWGAFDVDNSKEILNMVPFADHNALLDPSTADVTARILEMLGVFGYDESFSPASRAVSFLRSQQEKDGAWYGRWGVNYIYGTWQVITGLVRIGVSPADPCIQRGVEWLLKHQNSDGGWGETVATYDDPSLRGQGDSTPSQTAWALMGLMYGGAIRQDAVKRGIQYLLENQMPDGSWKEEHFTGTGFPRVFYLRYTFYRNYFPLMALGFYRSLMRL